MEFRDNITISNKYIKYQKQHLVFLVETSNLFNITKLLVKRMRRIPLENQPNTAMKLGFHISNYPYVGSPFGLKNLKVALDDSVVKLKIPQDNLFLKNRNTKMQKKESSFFTLVELLVVIAVFSILISMLQPALKRAWEKGYGIACQGNLKQLATASVMYTEDNNDYLPPELFSDSAGNAIKPWFWVAVLNPYLPPQVQVVGERPQGMWACPSSRALVTYTYSDYGKNRVLGYKSGKIEWWVSSVRVGKINKPSQVFYVADGANDLTNSNCILSINPYFWTFPKGNLGARHANNFNVLYADFHVDSQSLVDVTFPATMSAAYTISVPLPWGWDQ